MKRLRAWINGRFVKLDDAKISISDRGFLYGDGVFETMRSYAGAVFRIDAHLDRLFKTLEIVRIKPPHSEKFLKNIIYKSLKTNGLKNAYIRLTITRGEGRFGLAYNDIFVPNAVVVTKEFGEYPSWMYSTGIRAKVVSTRQNERSPLSGIKSLNFLNYILARLDAEDSGFDEAIMMNTKGYIAEGSTCNIFLVRKGRVLTPSLDSGVLPGITRMVVIEIAKRLGMNISERPIGYGELLNADEVFLTNSLIEVLPVTRIGPRRVGDGRVGDITKLLHISYQKQVIRESLF